MDYTAVIAVWGGRLLSSKRIQKNLVALNSKEMLDTAEFYGADIFLDLHVCLGCRARAHGAERADQFSKVCGTVLHYSWDYNFCLLRKWNLYTGRKEHFKST